jgi:nucleoside-diphosphate-sugar epimerase
MMVIMRETGRFYKSASPRDGTHLSLRWNGRIRFTVPSEKPAQDACWTTFRLWASKRDWNRGMLGLPGLLSLTVETNIREGRSRVNDRQIVIAGAGGFIGGSLVAALRQKDCGKIRAVDIKPLEHWYQRFDDVENLRLDLNEKDNCEAAARGAAEIYNLAANMGGMGFIERNRAQCMLSVLINTHMLIAARKCGVERYFYSSSACVYNGDIQHTSDDGERYSPPALKETDAYPALPEDGYGWEKLFSERMCRHFTEDFGLNTRVARFHNVYGPWGTWFGGREKAPAAICRKVIEAQFTGNHEIEIWGNGHQTRSFMFIDDCIKGIDLICDSNISVPINLGSSEAVSINQLVDIVEDIAKIKLRRRYIQDAPKGVNGRNSDNTLIRKRLGWEPTVPLRIGLEKTFGWIREQYQLRQRGGKGVVREIDDHQS